MNEFLPFIVVGVTVGSVYALAGVGLVLTYKTSGIFNFAHGALATLAAYLFYAMNVQHGIPWGVAGFVTVFILGPLLGLLFESFARGLSSVSMAWRITATVGILLSIESLCTILFGSDSRTFPHFLPVSGFKLSGVSITWEQVIVTAVPLVATAALYAVFRLTRVGMAMRAVVEQPELLALAGTSPRNVRRWAWMIGCSFATLSGVLLAPNVSLDPTTLTLLIVQAFGAAAIGNFSNLPMTWVGGIVIGVAGSVVTKYGTSNTMLAGFAPSLPFIVLFLVLVLSPRSRLGVRQLAVAVRPTAWRAPNRVQALLGVAVIALFACVPLFAGFRINTYTVLLTTLLIFMSLGLLVRVAGQVSLCQLTFAAIGAAEFSRLAIHGHLPWLAALLVGGLIAVPIGAILAIPAIRFSGLFLALATLGFGLLVQDMFYPTKLMFGFGGVGLDMPRPHLSWLSVDSDKGFYYVVLVITIVIALGTVALTRTRLGRILQGVADSPTAMQSNGNSVQVALVLVFCISAFIAAVGGALQGMVFAQVGALNYNPITSVLYLAVVLISVGSEPWYALVPAAGLTLLPLYIHSSDTSNYLQLFFGVAAVTMALSGQPKLAGVVRLRQWLDRIGEKRPVETPHTAGAEPATEPVGRAKPIRIELRDVTVQFGGLVAVRQMGLTAQPGQIVGLIGPNGAGKTTTLNAISGFVTPKRGEILFSGQDVRRRSPAARARLGLGRTYQQMELCDSLSVWDNVLLGREASLAGASVVRQVVPRSGESTQVRESVARAIERCGLAPLAAAQAGTLSSSERRFVEIARCLAGPFSFLLLDEPSSGLDKGATERLGQLVRTLVDEDGIGVLLVEHDMSLVMSICDDIYVMDFGGLLFHGSPAEVQRSPEVRGAYLGAEADATAAAESARQHAAPLQPEARAAVES